MSNPITGAASVQSLNDGLMVEVSGFDVVDESVHMIEWLGKGKDFRKFVANDVEAELYAQDIGSQLIAVHCKATPDYKTGALPNNDGTTIATLTQFSATFPLVVKVRASNGKIWNLGIEHNYVATNLNIPGQHRLKLNFKVVD
jgi:hypothetical protein